jgi:hypothetical protein
MKVLVNGKETDGLSARQERQVSVGKALEDIAGSVVTAEEATETVMRWTRILFTFLAVFAGLLMIGMMAAAFYGLTPSERGPTLAFAAVILVAMAGLIRWGYRRTERRWLARLPERVAALPAPGTAVRLDVAGVTIGHHSFAWPQLSVSQIEFVMLSGADDTSYVVERLMLRGGGRDVTLDRNLMQNGPLIVENAYRRLLRDTAAPIGQ